MSGVRVGDREYPGFPASGAGLPPTDPDLRVAFFALSWDQDVASPVSLFARDDAGNEGLAQIEHRTFPKAFRKSVINVDDAFLAKVVPAILQNTPDFKVDSRGDLIGSYIRINRDLRKVNDARIASLALETAQRILWEGPFKQLGNTAVEAGFADSRTYNTKAIQWITRRILVSTLPPQLPHRCWQRIMGRLCMRAGSAYMATVSFWITGWDCNRSMRTCPSLVYRWETLCV